MSYVFCQKSFYINNKKNLLAKSKMKKVLVLGYSDSKGVMPEHSNYSCITEFSDDAFITLNNKIRGDRVCLGVAFHDFLSLTASIFIEQDLGSFFDVYFVSIDQYTKDWSIDSNEMKEYKNKMSKVTNSFVQNSMKGVLPQKY